MSNDINMINLVNAIRSINKVDRPNNLIFGKVTSIDPLKIDIGNNVILTSKYLFLGQMCRPHKVKIPHKHLINVDTTTNSTGITFEGQGTITDPSHKHKIDNKYTEDVHKESSENEDYVIIEIEPKLKVNDTVLMFAFNDYQMYYVAERIEE